MNLKQTFLITALSFTSCVSVFAYTYGSGYTNSSYISHYNSHSSTYQGTWRGNDSRYIRNFNTSGSSGQYFGVPTGTSFGSTSYISRKHRNAYVQQLRAARKEQARLNNLPPPCGNYGRLPRSCTVAKFGSR